MDRRRPALVALLLFVAFTGAAIVVSGSRPASDEGALPWALQVIGYLCAVAAGVLLLTGQDAAGRRTGMVVTAAVVVLALLDVLVPDEGGANIGAGLVRLVLLVVLAVATVRLSLATAAARRSRPAS
ncbi:hypothetical protein GCU60_09480 [Blastococcus saxobsidens]|uniref:Uncharacterized protein n=1 Tax=Blastococcus saxobsidens TaxID=138336 RepID=A0A6L9W2E6_9ACTN|nr:hypothetical protein [Blastococcus saxobsidens]NEK85992.1 hypothetical protein [Blastococcus saxobsidens]